MAKNKFKTMVRQMAGKFIGNPTKKTLAVLIQQLSALEPNLPNGADLPPKKIPIKPAPKKLSTKPGEPKQVFANKIQRNETDDFWSDCGGFEKRHEWTIPKERKLKLLKQMSFVVIPYQNQSALEDRRKDFEDRKRHLAPMDKYSVCFSCGNPATDRHHIIQLKNGGINSRRNIVLLCRDCHESIHPWMKEARFVTVTENRGTSTM